MIETMPAVAPETVTPLRPSEALRLGRLTRPLPIQGDLLDDKGGACAVGAILTGIGDESGSYSVLWEAFPAMRREVSCPADDDNCEFHGDGIQTVMDRVIGLNDLHSWSDDQIVAWLEGLGL